MFRVLGTREHGYAENILGSWGVLLERSFRFSDRELWLVEPHLYMYLVSDSTAQCAVSLRKKLPASKFHSTGKIH